MRAAAAIAKGPDWRVALRHLNRQWRAAFGRDQPVDLAVLFAGAAYAGNFAALLGEVRASTGATLLVGCSGQGVIGTGREIEGEPALSLLVLSLPGARLRASHLLPDDVEHRRTPQAWHRLTGVYPADVTAWLLLADPFSMDAEMLLGALSVAYPGVPLMGGMASGSLARRRTHLFLNGRVYDRGAVALALGGPYRVRPLVAQGAAPIGRPWTVTGARGNAIETIGQRPAYRVLAETLQTLPAPLQQRAEENLLVGLAMDEYRDVLRHGDFLIRNLLGVIPGTGALAVAGLPRIGQTMQFQLRDPEAADEELRVLLQRAAEDLGDRRPGAALLFSCNGRGVGLFGTPDHDARAVEAHLGPVPLAGVFCNGEIGPVGERAYLHGFTASLALIVPEESAAGL